MNCVTNNHYYIEKFKNLQSHCSGVSRHRDISVGFRQIKKGRRQLHQTHHCTSYSHLDNNYTKLTTALHILTSTTTTPNSPLHFIFSPRQQLHQTHHCTSYSHLGIGQIRKVNRQSCVNSVSGSEIRNSTRYGHLKKLV